MISENVWIPMGYRLAIIVIGLYSSANIQYFPETTKQKRQNLPVPDLEKQMDLEKLKHKSLMKEFNLYKEMAQKPRARIKEVRVEALREGFKQCFKDKDFATILLLGDKIPQNILTEDEVLLQYYDIASMRQ